MDDLPATELIHSDPEPKMIDLSALIGLGR
jgi:hypothetical protein